MNYTIKNSHMFTKFKSETKVYTYIAKSIRMSAFLKANLT